MTWPPPERATRHVMWSHMDSHGGERLEWRSDPDSPYEAIYFHPRYGVWRVVREDGRSVIR